MNEKMEIQKDYVIEALCDALDDCFEYQEIEGQSEGYAIKYDGDLGDFNSNFILAILDNDCDETDECEYFVIQTFDLSSYWNNPSELMTLGKDILSDIADEIIEIIDDIENN